MDTDLIWRHIDRERSWLADLLDSLPDDDWSRPSLCDGWTVRDVAAHLTLAHTPLSRLLLPALRAGFRYDVLIRDTAVRSPLGRNEIVATLRGFVGSRRRVAFITDAEPLIDILVHTQDVCLPLGIDHPMPPEAAAAAADRVVSTPWPLRRWTAPSDVRLVATDVDWAHGTGPTRSAPMQEHLLTLTGRRPPTGPHHRPPRPVRGAASPREEP